jgi:hypothetical protein
MKVTHYLIQDSVSGYYLTKNRTWDSITGDSEIWTFNALEKAKHQFKYVCIYYGVVSLQTEFAQHIKKRVDYWSHMHPGLYQAARLVAERLRIVKVITDLDDPTESSRQIIKARLQKSRLAYTGLDQDFKTTSLKTNFICNLKQNPFVSKYYGASHQVDVSGMYKESKILLSTGIGHLSPRSSILYGNDKGRIPMVFVTVGTENKNPSNSQTDRRLYTLDYTSIISLNDFTKVA